MDRESPLLQPSLQCQEVAEVLREHVADTGEDLAQVVAVQTYAAWVGFDCTDVAAAIWVMRALAVANCDARREETVVFVPINPEVDATGDRVIYAVSEAFSLARSYGVLRSALERHTSVPSADESRSAS